MTLYREWRVAPWLPTGTAGPWTIERFTVSQAASARDRVMAAIHGSARYCPAGTYTRLMDSRTLFPDPIMSDTDDEVRDHLAPYLTAHGSVLIHGLGLGMFASMCLRKAGVTDVTVVEKDAAVIGLVFPHLNALTRRAKLTVIHDDAFTWQPPKGARWNVVWHDVWSTLCGDNLPQMHQLHRRFARRADWQGSWSRALIERMA